MPQLAMSLCLYCAWKSSWREMTASRIPIDMQAKLAEQKKTY